MLSSPVDISTLSEMLGAREWPGATDRDRAAGQTFGGGLSGLLSGDSPAGERRDDGAAEASDARIREAADALVSLGFVQPLLKMVRQSPLRSELMHGGFGEDAFGRQLDMMLADRVAERTSGSIGEAIYRHLTRGGEPVAGRIEDNA